MNSFIKGILLLFLLFSITKIAFALPKITSGFPTHAFINTHHMKEIGGKPRQHWPLMVSQSKQQSLTHESSGSSFPQQQQSLSDPQNIIPLKYNQPHTFSLNMSFRGGYQSFSFSVSSKMTVVTISVSSPYVDLDLYLQKSNPIASYQNVDFSDTRANFSKTFQLTRFNASHMLQDGKYYLDLVCPYPLSYLLKNKLGTDIPFKITLTCQYIHAQTLLPNRLYSGKLYPETGMFHTYKIFVRPGTPHFRIDLVGAQKDLDLFLEKDTGVGFPLYYLSTGILSITPLANERINIDEKNYGPLGGWYWVSVLNSLSRQSANYEIIFSFGEHPPIQAANACHIHKLKVYQGIKKPLSTVVEVESNWDIGSGTVVSPQGYILTNFHVIKNPSNNLPQKNLAIAYTIDPSQSPQELFEAKTIAYSPSRDLALLKIYQGFYGQALNSSFAFPYEKLPSNQSIPTLIHWGETLFVVGYPYTGDYNSRASITITKGIVSGFIHSDDHLLVKTDANISEGNSGGLVMNDQGQLIGIPSSIVLQSKEDINTAIGFFIPISEVPTSWKHLIQTNP